MNLLNIYGSAEAAHEAHKILSYFGKLFEKNAKFYAYPYQPTANSELQTAKNLKVHHCLQDLHNYIVKNNCIQDIENYNPEVLQIFSDEVIKQIRAGEDGWEDKVPDHVSTLIKKNCLFGYPCEWIPPEKDFSIEK